MSVIFDGKFKLPLVKIRHLVAPTPPVTTVDWMDKAATDVTIISHNVKYPSAPYSGAWRTDQSAVVSDSYNRTLNTNHLATTFQWTEALGSGKRYIELFPSNIVTSNTSSQPLATEAGVVGFSVKNTTNAGATGLYNSTNLVWSSYTTDFRINNTAVSNVTFQLWTPGKYQQIAIDTINKKIWLGVNGQWSNGATVDDIANGLKGIAFTQDASTYYLSTLSNYSGNGSFTTQVNNGQLAYQYPVPAGFTPMGTPVS